MGKLGRTVLIGIGALVLLLVVVVLALPMFLNTDSFRTRIETEMSKSLGRKVTLGKVSLAIWRGGLVAENAIVADDPAFSTQPFLQASSVKIGVEVLPLILHREIHVRGFDLDAPKISLLRGANGMWNYSSIGGAKSETPSNDQNSMIPNLTVGHVTVTNGQLMVGSGPGVTGTSALPSRVYDQLNLDVKDFSFSKSFPFTATAHLPGGATVDIKGTAGPVNQQDASLTPFSAHLEMKHLDPLAAGFVDASSGLTGTIDGITVDANWSGQQLHVNQLLLDAPRLTLVKTNTPPKAKTAAPDDKEGSDMLKTISVDDLELKNGTITMKTAGQAGNPAVYQNLNAKVTNFSPKSVAPFTASAQLPGGGSLQASGKAGPLNEDDGMLTPMDAQVSLKHLDLATSGVIAPDAGIGGVANLDAHAISNGQMLNANGTAHVDGLRLAKNGSPSGKPVDLKFALTQNMQAMTGQVQQAMITVGRTAVNIAGTYQTSGPTTAINLKVAGNAMPIDELEAFLPALGVHLPTGSRLQGGTMTTALNVTGSTANPVISGPVKLENTQLAGFDLGSKLGPITQLTGTKTGSVTQVKSLSMNVHVAGGAVRTDNIALNMPALGTATGAGTVSDGGGLNYNVVLKPTILSGGGAAATNAAPAAGGGGIAGQIMGMIPGGAAGGTFAKLSGGALKGGIPVAIGGTTSNPTFMPNMKGLIGGVGAGVAGNLLNGQKGGAKPGVPAVNGKDMQKQLGNALGGLLGKH